MRRLVYEVPCGYGYLLPGYIVKQAIVNMADTRNRASSPTRGVRNRSREKDRVKEPEKTEEKPSVDREKVLFKCCCCFCLSFGKMR